MIEEKIFTAEFVLESVEESQGKFFFTATSLDSNFECEKGREVLARESIKKPLIWRHQHPIQEGNQESHIYGYVVNSSLEEGNIKSKYEVYGHTKEHLAIRELIREKQRIGDPLGISMRFRKYFIGDEILHYDVFEHSGTPFPKCTNCTTIDIGVENMVNEKEKKEIKDEDKDDSKDEGADKDIKETKEKIEALEKMLNSKTSILEDYKTRLETLEDSIKSKDEKLEEADKKEKTLEEKMEDLNLEISYLKKKPIIDEILEYKKIDERYLEWLKTQDDDYLKGKLEEAKHEAETKIQVKSQEDSAKDAKEHADEEFDKKEPTMEEFTKLLNLKEKDKEK